MKKINCVFDGACEPKNPGGYIGYGSAMFDENKKLIVQNSGYKKENPYNTNNVAEYMGLESIFRYIDKKNIVDSEINIYGDSQLVINQMKGDWNINDGVYKTLATQCRVMLTRLIINNNLHFNFIWIPREKNTYADKLSKKSLEAHGIKSNN